MTIACILIFFFKQKTAYEMRISDWSSDVCSSDLEVLSLDSVGDGVIQGAGVRVVLRADAGTEQISALADRVGAQLKAVPDQAMSVTRMPSVVFATLIFLHRVHAVDRVCGHHRAHRRGSGTVRSEEHTSELQSLMRISYAVFCLK